MTSDSAVVSVWKIAYIKSVTDTWEYNVVLPPLTKTLNQTGPAPLMPMSSPNLALTKIKSCFPFAAKAPPLMPMPTLMLMLMLMNVTRLCYHFVTGASIGNVTIAGVAI
jgi:hypothetical protein